MTGGCGLVSNLELLNACASGRPTHIFSTSRIPTSWRATVAAPCPTGCACRYADEIVGELPIASLIAMVDEVHVNTSLAGFEALLRGKAVTTHGVPFYAGWGLTRDLGPVPARRTARRTSTSSLPPHCCSTRVIWIPLTGLPCPAEVVVARLNSDEKRDRGLLVGMRRLQGKLMRRLRSLVQ